MIRILIATSDRKAGGIQRALQDQIALFADDDDLSLSVLAPASDFADHLASQSTDTGLTQILLSDRDRWVMRHMPWFTRWLFQRRLPASQRKCPPQAQYDIALCHNGFLAKGLKQMAKQVIGICHNDKPHHFQACDKLVCLTQAGRNKALAQGWNDTDICVIGHYHESDATPKSSQKQPVIIGAAGRMVAKKNFALFLNIAALVKKTHPHISFHLAGTGPLESQLQAQNQALGAPVTLLGWTNFNEFLDQISLLIVPSSDEPFGYVFPEAMSQSVAIMATPTNGALHCLSEGDIAPIISADTPEEFAKKIIALAENESAMQALQQRCYNHSQSRLFAKQAAYEAWRALLR